MNKKSLTLAAIIGVALGIFVLHPLWVSFHAFDGQHGENSSWLEFMVRAYPHSLSFVDIQHTLVSIFSGIVISVFVLMMVVRKKRKSIGRES